VVARAGEVQHDFATLLDLLSVADIGLTDDMVGLFALTSQRCRRLAVEELRSGRAASH